MNIRWPLVLTAAFILILNREASAQEGLGCKWTPYPTPDQLFSVSAIGPTDIWAGGPASPAGSTALVHWDGSQWSTVYVSSNNGPARGAWVSATADNDIWAVASYTNQDGTVHPYSLHFDGLAWTQQLLHAG